MGLAVGGGSGPRREAAKGRGACPPSSPPGPAPAASAELSSGLRGLPRHAAPPPGPAPHSPPRARNLFSRECQGVLRGLYFPGAQGAPEFSRFCSWEGRRKIRGLEHPRCSPSLSQLHADLVWPPTNSRAFIHCEAGEGLRQLESKAKAPW